MLRRSRHQRGNKNRKIKIFLKNQLKINFVFSLEKK